MIVIKKKQSNFQKDMQNAIIVDNTIIPGLNGYEVDLSKSYQKMKKLNVYNPSLLVYKEIKPNVSIYNNFDKYIINGNCSLKQVSILLKINDLKLVKEISNQDINLMVTSSFLNNNYVFFQGIGNNLVINQNDYLRELANYCYSLNINEKNNCKDLNKFTIIPTFINYNYYFNTIKIIKNGAILAYNIVNLNDLKEIKILIGKINNLGYQIVSLDKLVNESYF